MTTEVLTPTVRATARRWVYWVVAVIAAAVIGLASLALGVTAGGGRDYDPDNPGPTGTMALVEVLRDQGVQAVRTSDLGTTRSATAVGTSTTLVIHDIDRILDAEQLADAARLADTVIVLDPDFAALSELAPEVAQAGSVTGTATADCDVAAVERAGRVTIDGDGFRVTGSQAGTIACLGSGDGIVSFVGLDRADTELWLLGALDALTNDRVDEEGNAAFALGILGQHPRLVWYVPSFDDLPPGGSIEELSPTWVVPVMLLLALCFVLAAVWRGRRLGPLIVEPLPVTVRASETMQGRARLYARSSARLRALDALRVGTIQRLAVRCGLSSLATVDEVVAAVAAVTNADPQDLRRLLVEREPASDRELVAYSDALLTLERDVAARLRP